MVIRKQKKLSFGEWEAEYYETITKRINEEFKRVSEAIMKEQEPKLDPKLIVDKLKQVTEDAAKLKLEVRGDASYSNLVCEVGTRGIDIVDSNTYRSNRISMNMSQVLAVRDWMTTLLGEDKLKVVERTPSMFIPYYTPSCHSQPAEWFVFLCGMGFGLIASGVGLVLLWK